MKEPYISLTTWLTPADLAERARAGDAHAVIHLVIPHGKGTRAIPVKLGVEQCLALCANAADAARLLSEYERRRP